VNFFKQFCHSRRTFLDLIELFLWAESLTRVIH
jgi:hypothetical protein